MDDLSGNTTHLLDLAALEAGLAPVTLGHPLIYHPSARLHQQYGDGPGAAGRGGRHARDHG